MSLLLLRQVVVYGTRIPQGDDWLMLSRLRGDGPITVPETWWLRADDTLPLANLVYPSLVGGLHDVRAGTWLTALLLVATAFACVHVAGNLRGRVHATDAVFPLVLLHGAQCANTLNSIQFLSSVCTALTVLGLLLMVTFDGRVPTRTIELVGLAGIALPFTWIGGVPQGLAWSAWIVSAWFVLRRTPDAGERRVGWTAWLFVAGISVAAAWVVLAYRSPPGFIAPTPIRTATAALQFLSRGIGEPSSLFRPAGSVIVAVLIAWTVFLFARRRITDKRLVLRALGLVLVLVSLCGTALVVGLHRMLRGDGSGLDERFGLVAAPLWCAFGIAAALLWEQRAARILAWVLFGLLGVSWLPNFLAGEREGLARRHATRLLEEDLARGLTLEEAAAARWAGGSGSPEAFLSALRDLEDLRLGPFAAGPHDPAGTRPAAPFEMLRTAPLPKSVVDGVHPGQSGSARVLFVSDDKHLHFALGPEPLGVRGAFGVSSALVESGTAPAVRFEVTLVRLDGTSAELFARTLDPVRVPSDRGDQPFGVRLDATAAFGSIVLHVVQEGEPRDTPAGYWRDVLVR